MAFLTVAMPLASARQSHVAAVAGSRFQIVRQIFPKASESFPALAFLFLLWLLSPLQLFCFLTTPFSFAIFLSLVSVLASGLQISSISLKQVSVRAFRSALALELPSLPRQILSPTLIYEDAAMPLVLAMLQFRPPAFLLPVWLLQLDWVILLLSQMPQFSSSISPLRASISGSGLVIPLVSGKRRVSSSTCLLPLWLSQSGSATFLAPEMRRPVFRFVPSQIPRAGFFRYH